MALHEAGRGVDDAQLEPCDSVIAQLGSAITEGRFQVRSEPVGDLAARALLIGALAPGDALLEKFGSQPRLDRDRQARQRRVESMRSSLPVAAGRVTIEVRRIRMEDGRPRMRRRLVHDLQQTVDSIDVEADVGSVPDLEIDRAAKVPRDRMRDTKLGEQGTEPAAASSSLNSFSLALTPPQSISTSWATVRRSRSSSKVSGGLPSSTLPTADNVAALPIAIDYSRMRLRQARYRDILANERQLIRIRRGRFRSTTRCRQQGVRGSTGFDRCRSGRLHAIRGALSPLVRAPGRRSARGSR